MKFSNILICSWIVGIATVLICACVPQTPSGYHPDESLVVRPVLEAATGAGKIEVLTQAAEKNVLAAKKDAPESLYGRLDAASDDHQAVLQETPKLQAQLQQALNDKAAADAYAQKAVTERDEMIAGQKTAMQKLEGKWYVVWGRFIEFWLRMIIIGWAVLGLVSVVCGLSNPLGWIGKIGGFIVHLIPIGNVFVWIEDGMRVLWSWWSKPVDPAMRSTAPAQLPPITIK